MPDTPAPGPGGDQVPAYIETQRPSLLMRTRHDILSRRDAVAEPQVQGWPALGRLGALAGEVIDGETMTEFRVEVDLAWLAKRIGAGDYNSH